MWYFKKNNNSFWQVFIEKDIAAYGTLKPVYIFGHGGFPDVQLAFP